MEEQLGIGYSSTVFEILPCNQWRWSQFTLLMSPLLYKKTHAPYNEIYALSPKCPQYHSRLPEKSVDEQINLNIFSVFAVFGS